MFTPEENWAELKEMYRLGRRLTELDAQLRLHDEGEIEIDVEEYRRQRDELRRRARTLWILHRNRLEREKYE